MTIKGGFDGLLTKRKVADIRPWVCMDVGVMRQQEGLESREKFGGVSSECSEISESVGIFN